MPLALPYAPFPEARDLPQLLKNVLKLSQNVQNLVQMVQSLLHNEDKNFQNVQDPL